MTAKNLRGLERDSGGVFGDQPDHDERESTDSETREARKQVGTGLQTDTRKSVKYANIGAQLKLGRLSSGIAEPPPMIPAVIVASCSPHLCF